MAKKTDITGYHVQVDTYSVSPYIGRYIEPDEQMRECKSIEEQIKRHVDNVYRTWIVEETNEYCEFCGSVWTEESNTFNGGCCDEDMESK